MLTGEAVPTPKFEIEDSEEKINFEKRNMLYEGTKVLQSKPTHQKYVMGLVIRTGFTSFKGQLIRAILFPKPVEFGFHKQGIKYIGTLAIIFFILYFLMLWKMIQLEMGTFFYVFRLLDTITWCIPPSLPIFMSLIVTCSVMRLKTKNIVALNPNSVNLAGKVTY